MEELFAYALMLIEGFEVEEEYDKKLDELFLSDPTNDDYLELESLGSNIKESVFYIMSHIDCRNISLEKYGRDIDCRNINLEKFGKELMRLLRIEYDRMDIREFAKHTYPMWENLPWSIAEVEPFRGLSYADDPLSWGDFEQSKKLYEQMLDFYD